MNDPRIHTPQADPAADAIRAALPGPDDAAVDRIARRIETGTSAHGRRRGARDRRRRPVRLVRPLLALGAAGVAVAVAFLAPGTDPTSPGGMTRFAPGPDLAAADALEVAGATVAGSGSEWRALRPGEYHYTRTVDSSFGRRVRATTERWIALDGTGRVRVTREPAYLERGSRYFVPAQTCAALRPPVPGGLPPTFGTRLDTLPAGARIPGCWSSARASLGLDHATGVVIAAPPAGAHVEVPLTFAAPHDRALRFGTDVREEIRDTDADEPAAPAADVEATAVLPARQDVIVDPATTWIEVEAERTVVIDHVGGDLDAWTSPIGSRWTDAIALSDIAGLPTDVDELGAVLRREAAGMNRAELERAAAGRPAAPFRTDLQATVVLAMQLLTEAPMSPSARRATFGVLGELAEEAGATVRRDVRLPDGPAALEIAFPLPQPPRYDDGREHRYLLYLDERTATLLGTRFDLGQGDDGMARWTPPTRVASTEETGRE